MNEVQRNFKRQQKQIEQEYKNRWRKEHYKDRATGKKYVQYYDLNGQLMKTVEKHSPVRIIIGTVIAAIVVVSVAAVVIGNIHTGPTASFQTETTAQKITLDSLSSQWDNHILYITGKVHNISGKTIKKVHLTVTLQNDEYKAIGTETADAQNMAPSDVWDFKIPVNQSDGVKHFSVEYSAE